MIEFEKFLNKKKEVSFKKMRVIKLTPGNFYAIHTLEGTGTAFLDRDMRLNGAFLYNPDDLAVSLKYYPDLINHETSYLNIYALSVSSTETNSFRHAGLPLAGGTDRTKLVYTLGSSVTLTLYLTQPHIGS